jgi:hypothetical protein
MYIDIDYYNDYSGLIKEDVEKKIKKACRDIDAMTFNRINSIGF